MADGARLTLRQAREQGRLSEFAAQAERDLKDAVPITAEQFDAALGRMLKPATAANRTSRFRTGDGSPGKRTRRGTSASSPADLDVRRAHAVFEQLPKALNRVGRIGFIRPPVVVAPLLSAVFDGAVSEAIAG
jgi:hypothetical protein